MPVDYSSARYLLDTTFAEVEACLLQGTVPEVDKRVQDACDLIFSSRTQAYREVLLGCLIVRIQDKSINLRQPYLDQGPKAYSGRSIDERVVNPFLHDKRIPSSRGPYLSVFRRSVQFHATTRTGLKDKAGYDAFLDLIACIERLSDDAALRQLLKYVLYRFARLREEADVPIARLQRISLEQYDAIISGLLATPSGGRLPVLLVVATFLTIKQAFQLDWDIQWQGINVADTASGAGGDVTIMSQGQVLLSAEVTERMLDRPRIVATFNSKISPAGIEDYLFFVRSATPTDEARQQARQYFAQGHEVNFLDIRQWILMVLATLGHRGRAAFNETLLKLLSAPEVPRSIKVHWNGLIGEIAAG